MLDAMDIIGCVPKNFGLKNKQEKKIKSKHEIKQYLICNLNE
jgi:hypothetical protein